MILIKLCFIVFCYVRKETDILWMDGWLQSAGEYRGRSRITEGTGVSLRYQSYRGLVISGVASHSTERGVRVKAKREGEGKRGQIGGAPHQL